MAFTPVNPTDPLDQPSHSGLHNQHSTDIEAAQGDIATLSDFMATLAGGEAGEVLAKTTGDDYDFDWLPGGTGGGPGGDYPGISTEDPNGLGLGTDGALRVEPSDLLSDNAGQQLTVAPDDGKLYFGGLPDDFGKVLQVVRATDRSQRSTTSTSFVDVTGMSVTITPKKATSNLIIVAIGFSLAQNLSGSGDSRVLYQITDSANAALSGAEVMGLGLSGGSTATANSNLNIWGYVGAVDTTARTYKLRFFVTGGTGYLSGSDNTSQMYAIEVAA